MQVESGFCQARDRFLWLAITECIAVRTLRNLDKDFSFSLFPLIFFSKNKAVYSTLLLVAYLSIFSMARVLKNSRQLYNHPLQIYCNVSELQTDVVRKSGGIQ